MNDHSMNVAELITALAKLPLDAKVLLHHCSNCGGDELFRVELEDEGDAKYVVLFR